MKQVLMKNDTTEVKSYKEMLIYEMNRSEKIDKEIRHYKNQVKILEEYVEYLERRIYLH